MLCDEYLAFCLYYLCYPMRFFRFSQVPTQANDWAFNVHLSILWPFYGRIHSSVWQTIPLPSTTSTIVDTHSSPKYDDDIIYLFRMAQLNTVHIKIYTRFLFSEVLNLCRVRTCAGVNVCTHEHTPGRAHARRATRITLAQEPCVGLGNPS